MASAIPYADNLKQQTESQTFTDPFAFAPEIYGINTFDFGNDLNVLLVAENLASEVKCLMNILKTTPLSDIHDQFQIELRKTDTQDDQCFKYQMLLRIDSILWFKHHKLHTSNTEDLKQLYQIGSDYAEKVKRDTECYPKILDEHNIKRIPISSSRPEWCHIERRGETCQRNEAGSCPDRHYQWCDNETGNTGECTMKHNRKVIHTLEIDKDNIPVYQCRHRSTKLNREQAFCLFNVDPNFWIYHDKVSKSSLYPYFIVAARNNATPVITLNPVKHCRNEDYLQSSDAWQAVLQTLKYMKNQLKIDKLPLNRIYVNFGKWMQQKTDDPTCRDCHAHINIVLTRQTIEKINDINRPKDTHRRGKKLYQCLVGSILPPKLHRLDDSLKLIEHMNNHMTPVLIRQNQELVSSISTLKNELEIIKEENKKFRKLIFAPTYVAQEAEDSTPGTDADDVGIGVNDKLCSNSYDEQETTGT
ncbi:unnamed protein product [Rotaria sordida]|uniref:Uncharacterized protein n=2 Tax=Rotaria sordida TaxID=392033 RepID=A0A819SGD5_9BILA|nr:unnamed protein product [Rotaria sordida]